MAGPQIALRPRPRHRSLDVESILCMGFFHVLGIGALFFVPVCWKTCLLVALGHTVSGMAVTAGYHRLWGHRVYSACRPLRYALAILASAAIQKDIIWWVRHHR